MMRSGNFNFSAMMNSGPPVALLALFGLVVVVLVGGVAVWLFVGKKLAALRIMGGVFLGLAVLSAAGLWLSASRNWYVNNDYSGYIFAVAALVIVGAVLIILGSAKPSAAQLPVAAVAASVPVVGDALAVARQRLAAGEISSEEFDQISARLR